MRFAPLAAAVLLLLVFGTAQAVATTLVLPDGTQRPQPYQSWVDRSLVPTPPGVVTLHLDECPVAGSAGGCVIEGERAIYLAPEGRNRQTLLHELGHIVDAAVLPSWARTRFQALVRRPGAWAGAASADPPQERFAEAYALCAQRRKLTDTHFGMYDYAPSPRAHASACRLIRSAAAPAR